jgi:hypothetical protein
MALIELRDGDSVVVTVDIAEAFAYVPCITFLDHVGEQNIYLHIFGMVSSMCQG